MTKIEKILCKVKKMCLKEILNAQRNLKEKKRENSIKYLKLKLDEKLGLVARALIGAL